MTDLAVRGTDNTELTTDTTELTLLGQSVRGSIAASRIETFPAPEGVSVVTFSSEEFTAICPVTGQPDLYHLTFAYEPHGRCVESKALKLYLTGFRNEGVFCEALAARVLDDLVSVLDAGPATVVLRQQARGGLVLTARADRQGGAL
jgi:7-cyano-7-deazaguanine reductase